MVPNEMKRYWIKDTQAHKQPGWPQTTLIQLTSLQTFIMQCNFSKENYVNWRVLNLIYVSLIFNVSESENILLTGYQVTWSHSRLEWSCWERERERERKREIVSISKKFIFDLLKSQNICLLWWLFLFQWEVLQS